MPADKARSTDALTADMNPPSPVEAARMMVDALPADATADDVAEALAGLLTPGEVKGPADDRLANHAAEVKAHAKRLAKEG
ncbi:MAG: hypothetical protein ABIW84_10785 [Ilumatobacteraceae bacterium]